MAMATLVGQTLRAGLLVREQLADTPLGELYRAQYPSGVEVAIMSLRTDATDGDAIGALRQRLARAIQIQHPNVAAIYDLNETPDGLIYVVAECLEGELLSETLARRGTLPPEAALEIFCQAAAGLQAAHAAGSIHGNFSPETILLSPSVGRTQVKLVGFAQDLAAAAQSDPLAQGRGCVDYASPERVMGNQPDERSDVYSLGAVLHHLLTGAPPSRPAYAGSLPKKLIPVLARALAPSPERRYQTVTDFVAAIPTPVESQDEAAFAPSGESEHQEVIEPAKELGDEAALDLPTEQKYEPAIDPAVEAEYVAAFDPQPEQVVHLIPQRRTSPRRKLVRLGAVIAALAALSTGLWLLWGRPRLTLGALSPTRAEESGVVPRVDPESISASSSASLAAQRPVASAPGPAAAAAPDSLVDLRSVDSTIQVDLRYATANNFTGAPLPGYEAQRALLRPEAATALGRVQARIRGKGLGLRIFDAYRPLRASRAMVSWAESTGHRALLESGYIAERSRHNLGIAVDLTLVDRATGTEVPMGTTFDNFTTDAQPAEVDSQALRHRQTLADAMTAEGFKPYGQAWWHFNFPLDGAVPLDRVIR
jgi:D-alanyl-D-alanine dipeptidase